MKSGTLVAVVVLISALALTAVACTPSPASEGPFTPARGEETTLSPTVVTSASPTVVDVTETPTPQPSNTAEPVPREPAPSEPTKVAEPEPSPTPPPGFGAGAGTDGMVETPAPIESVEVQIAESVPPQYFLLVRSGLPNGCVRFGGYEVQRDGDTVHVKVTNLKPGDKNVMCTQVYGIAENRIPLGSDFKPGKKYTVVVNDVVEAFVAQDGGAETGPVPGPSPELGRPFSLGIGQTAAIESEGLEIGFVRVAEDSRCPTNVVCIWEGRVVIVVRLSSNGKDIGEHELSLQGGAQEPPILGIGKHSVELLALEAHPTAPGGGAQGEAPEYVATLVVTPDRPEGGTGGPPGQVEVSLGAEDVEGKPLTLRFVAEIAGGPDNNPDLY